MQWGSKGSATREQTRNKEEPIEIKEQAIEAQGRTHEKEDNRNPWMNHSENREEPIGNKERTIETQRENNRAHRENNRKAKGVPF